MNYLLGDIQKTIVDIVKNDELYNDMAFDLLKADLTYSVDAHILDEDEDIPSFTIYGIESIDENEVAEYFLQYVLTEKVEPRAENHDGVKVYPTKKNLEILAIEALKLIDKELRAVGVNGKCNLRIAHRSLAMTPVGEADDVKAIITLRLEEIKFI